jgi:hypothetical protein
LRTTDSRTGRRLMANLDPITGGGGGTSFRDGTEGSGANFGFQASSFFDSKGGPPGVGQLAILLDPVAFGGDAVLAHCETLLREMLRQPGVRFKRGS